MIALANDRNIDQVLLEFKEYASEVDVDFVRKVGLRNARLAFPPRTGRHPPSTFGWGGLAPARV